MDIERQRPCRDGEEARGEPGGDIKLVAPGFERLEA